MVRRRERHGKLGLAPSWPLAGMGTGMMQMPQLAEPLRVGLFLVVAAVLVVGTGLGIVYGALVGSLLGVLLSATIPGSAAIWVLATARRLQASGDRSADTGA